MAWVSKLAPRPTVSIDGDREPTWIGAGLRSAGIQAGTALDEEGKAAARLLLNGSDPRTGARWVRPAQRVHPDARLPGAQFIQALTARAEAEGVQPDALLQGKPKQQRALAQLTRMVDRYEAHRATFPALHRLAQAAGIDLADVYAQEELAAAYAHRNDRVENRTPAWTIVLDVPKSDSIVHGLMSDSQAPVLRRLLRRAAREAFDQLERWTG